MECSWFRDFIELELCLDDVPDVFMDAYRHMKTCPHCEEYLATAAREYELTMSEEARKRAKKRFRRFLKTHGPQLAAINLDIKRAV